MPLTHTSLSSGRWTIAATNAAILCDSSIFSSLLILIESRVGKNVFFFCCLSNNFDAILKLPNKNADKIIEIFENDVVKVNTFSAILFVPHKCRLSFIIMGKSG